MRIGIYKEAGKSSVGGAEYSMVILAEELSRDHEVEYITHHPERTKSHLSQVFGTPLERVALRYLPAEPYPRRQSLLPWRRYAAARAWQAEVSQPYDLFVNFTHAEQPPPFCHAVVGVLVVLFPFCERPSRWPYEKGSAGWGPFLKERLGRYYYEWEWRQRLHSYQVWTTNSHYTQGWTRTLWGLNTEVFYPPVDVDFRTTEKTNQIVSVGRFWPYKKQVELVGAFRQLADLHAQGWQLVSAGIAGQSVEEQVCWDQVRRAAEGSPVQPVANMERDRLRGLYEGAKIFWHAAGYGEDDTVNPAATEHFGIVTVEAMAAGCVPVVINKGGQPEIVRHGEDGFLWNTLDELADYTRLLARDEGLRARMAEAARARAQEFSTANYVRRFRTLVSPALPPSLTLDGPRRLVTEPV